VQHRAPTNVQVGLLVSSPLSSVPKEKSCPLALCFWSCIRHSLPPIFLPHGHFPALLIRMKDLSTPFRPGRNIRDPTCFPLFLFCLCLIVIFTVAPPVLPHHHRAYLALPDPPISCMFSMSARLFHDTHAPRPWKRPRFPPFQIILPVPPFPSGDLDTGRPPVGWHFRLAPPPVPMPPSFYFSLSFSFPKFSVWQEERDFDPSTSP